MPWAGSHLDASTDMARTHGTGVLRGSVLFANGRSIPGPDMVRILGTLLETTARTMLSTLRRAHKLREAKAFRPMKDHVHRFCAAIAYTLSRYACTASTAKNLLDAGAGSVALSLIPRAERLKKERHAKNAIADTFTSTVSHRKASATYLSLPATYFTFIANLCRVESFREKMVSLSLVERIVERFALSPLAAPLSDLRPIAATILESIEIRSLGEAALVLARLANTHVGAKGAANDAIISSGCVEALVGLSRASSGSVTYETEACRQTAAAAPRNALFALGQLSMDSLMTVPRMVHAGVVGCMVSIVASEDAADEENATATTQALRILHAVAAFPLRVHHKALRAAGAVEALQRLGYNFELELRGTTKVGEMARCVLECIDSKASSSKSSVKKLSDAQKARLFDGIRIVDGDLPSTGSDQRSRAQSSYSRTRPRRREGY